MGLTMPQRAAAYDLEYIEAQVKEAQDIMATARNRLRFWQEMLDVKRAQPND